MSVLERAKTGGAEAERERVWERRVARLKRRALRRRLVNVFIVWHCFAVAMWLLPAEWPVVSTFVPADGTGPVRAYMTATSFMQSWQMFAPNPDDKDIYMEAEIVYADHHTKRWMFPRMVDMGWGERYRRERFRKLIENAERDHRVWLPLAEYAARRNDPDPKNPPVKVTIYDHYRQVPPPGQPIPPYKTDVLCEVLLSGRNL